MNQYPFTIIIKRTEDLSEGEITEYIKKMLAEKYSNKAYLSQIIPYRSTKEVA